MKLVNADNLLMRLKNTKRMNNYLFDIAENDKCKHYYDGICAGITTAIQKIESELSDYKETAHDNCGWILLKDEFPKEGQRVIVTVMTGNVMTATYSRKIRRNVMEGFIFDDGFALGSYNILAWMPAPEGYMGGE